MNKIWLVMMLVGTAVLLFVNPSLATSTLIDASTNSLNLCINLCAIYAVWLGLLEILDKSGLAEKLSKLLKPIIKKLFPDADDETLKYISINISANMLGLGNAATPYGIKAMRKLDDGNEKANNSMLMLMIVNACSIQLLPTTTIGLRASAGSSSPADIILPTLLATICATAVGIGSGILCQKIFKRRKSC